MLGMTNCGLKKLIVVPHEQSSENLLRFTKICNSSWLWYDLYKEMVLPVPVESLIPWCLVQSNVSVVS